MFDISTTADQQQCPISLLFVGCYQAVLRCGRLPRYRTKRWCSDKLKFQGTVFRVASSWHSREDVRSKSCVSGDFPVQLATRLPDWSAGGLLRNSAARLSVCRVVFQIFPIFVARMLRGKLLPWNSSYSARHANRRTQRLLQPRRKTPHFQYPSL